MFYNFVLGVHNILRWVVLIMAVIALFRSYYGWISKREYTDRDRKIGIIFSSTLDLQLLLGLILYIFLSPITRTAFQDISLAMTVPDIRFFALEHIAVMILAIIFVHLGTMLSKKATSDIGKHRRSAIWFTLSTLAIVFAIPWWRPLLPGLGM